MDLGLSPKQKAEPQKRFELLTPGLQDQCSNHWATEASFNDTLKHYLEYFFIVEEVGDLFKRLWELRQYSTLLLTDHAHTKIIV